MTPKKTLVIKCTKTSTFFSNMSITGFENVADIYTMAADHCSPEVKALLPRGKAVFVNTVFQLLSSAKVLSYA